MGDNAPLRPGRSRSHETAIVPSDWRAPPHARPVLRLHSRGNCCAQPQPQPQPQPQLVRVWVAPSSRWTINGRNSFLAAPSARYYPPCANSNVSKNDLDSLRRPRTHSALTDQPRRMRNPRRLLHLHAASWVSGALDLTFRRTTNQVV